MDEVTVTLDVNDPDMTITELLAADNKIFIANHPNEGSARRLFRIASDKIIDVDNGSEYADATMVFHNVFWAKMEVTATRA